MLATIAILTPSADLCAAQSDSEKILAFVAKEQATIDKAKARLLKAIDRQARQIRRTTADEATRQFSLDRIAKERRTLELHDRLPSCDELLRPVFDFLDDYSKVHRRIVKDRQELLDTVQIRPNSAEAAKLRILDLRLNDFLGNPGQLAANSKWAGRRWDADGSLELVLEVHERSDNVFRGKLTQTGKFGRADTMQVAGALDGNVIEFRTTEMIRGEDRTFAFRGYLINDRIVAQLNGVSKDQKPVLAMVSLTRESARK
jgi:hypothetical protein